MILSKRILVILGHPNENSFCGALSSSYIKSAEASGNEVQFIALSKLTFDPIRHEGYGGNQPLETDLVAAQAAISWAQHIVLVYPIWWGTMPALMKGFIDRVFLPGFAFKYKQGSVFWDRLLAGRSAHLIVTMDSPPWYFRWVMRMPGHNQMKRSILGFCGIKPIKISSIGPVKGSSVEKREAWLARVADWARAK